MRFEDSKNLKAIELLKLLQEAVKKNAEKIKQYNTKAKMMIEGKMLPDNPNENIKSLSERMSNLTAENKKHIDLHNSLLSFLNALKSDDETNVRYIESFDVNSTPDTQLNFENEEDCFEKTISGLIPYNRKHPFYNNDEFKNKLIQHYINLEDYEKCDQLTRM